MHEAPEKLTNNAQTNLVEKNKKLFQKRREMK